MPYHDKNSLSQNFIKYRGLVSELVQAAKIDHDDLLVEIGGGRGIITQELAKVGKKVITVEKDKELAESLKKKFLDNPKVEVINQDFLNYHLPTLPYLIFANIPFSITAQIINKIINCDNKPSQMYLIMQKETAEKIIGGAKENQASVLTKPWYEIEILGEIDRTNFTQKPQIRIVFVKFVKRDRSFIADEDRKSFENFVIYGFNQWKESFGEAYKKILTHSQLITIKKMFGVDGQKPSEIDFDTWLRLYKNFKKIRNREQEDEMEIFVKRWRKKE